MTHRPNIFQRTLRRWEALHPYNAGQWMRLRAPFTPAAAAHAFAQVHEAFAAFWPGTSPPAPTILPDADARRIADHVTAQLNLPFAPDQSPLRPFIAPASGAAGPVLGLIYRHYVADSVSIRMVLAAWHAVLAGQAAPAPRRDDAGYWRLFGPSALGWSAAKAIARALSCASRRRARRQPSAGFFDLAAVYQQVDVPRGLAARLADVARQNAVKVHDVMTAAAAIAADRCSSTRACTRRPDLAVGSIVDLRANAGDRLDGVFGNYLGFYTATLPAHSLRTMHAAVAAAATINARARAEKWAAGNMICLPIAIAATLGRSGRRTLDWYRRRIPLAVGISNVNLAGEFPGPDVADFVRASPTGPMLPLVLTPTSLRGELSLGITYRAALISPQTAQQTADTFVALLCDYCGGIDAVAGANIDLRANTLTARPVPQPHGEPAPRA